MIKGEEDPIELAQQGFCPFSEPSFGIQKFRCADAFKCFLKFASIPESNVCIEEGLHSTTDLLATRNLLGWIALNCPHPQKLRVIELVEKAASIEVLVPWRVLEAMLQKEVKLCK